MLIEQSHQLVQTLIDRTKQNKIIWETHDNPGFDKSYHSCMVNSNEVRFYYLLNKIVAYSNTIGLRRINGDKYEVELYYLASDVVFKDLLLRLKISISEQSTNISREESEKLFNAMTKEPNKGKWEFIDTSTPIVKPKTYPVQMGLWTFLAIAIPAIFAYVFLLIYIFTR